MSSKKIGKQAEREAKEIIMEKFKTCKPNRLVIKGEVSGYYQGSMKDKGAIDLILINQGVGFQVKATKNPFFYFNNKEVEKILEWVSKTRLKAFYLIKFRLGKGRKSKWFFVPVTENLIDAKLVLREDLKGYSLMKKRKRREEHA